MKISTKSRYGLRAIAYLAKLEKICSLRKIAEDENIPFDYLEKIFSALEKEKLVKAKRGACGGYFLARSPEKISVGQVMDILEGSISSSSCLTKEKNKKCSCPRMKNCLTKNVWKKVQDTLNLTLNSITLTDLINKNL